MSNNVKVRTIILATGVTAITVTGAWYGAGLKIKQEFKQEVKTRVEASPADRIAFLEEARSRLVSNKTALESKISQLEARAAEERSADSDNGVNKKRF
ncbi:hypothetical protein BDR22DRAFT_889763 [Usnea florida]